ncbi:MAG: hypothetical protein PVI78_06150 [Anaerolineales bacterium]|jgi:hypothetical protein
MSTNDHFKADDFNQAIDELMTGSKTPDTRSVPTEDMRLANELLELSRSTVPEVVYEQQLERRLLQEAGQRTRRKRPVVNRRWVYASAGMALTAAVAFMAATLLGGRIPVPDNGIVGVVPSATSPIQTPEPTTPTEPQEQPLLPLLAELTGRGIGGQGGLTPEGLTLALETTLPSGPQALTVYSLGEVEVLTLDAARDVGAQFALGGDIYMPLWMADPQAVADIGHNSYFVLEGPRQVMLEGSESWEYVDRDGSLYYQGHFRDPVALPSEAEAQAIARSFLQEYGLLLPSSSTSLSGNVVRFYTTTVEGYEFSEPYAWISLGDGGKLESVRYRLFPTQSLGEYTLRTAEEAYAILTAGNPSDEIWFSSLPNLLPWGAFGNMNPQYWVRSRADGQSVDLFGEPMVLLPTTNGQQPYVQLQGIELQGMQAEIANFVIDMGGPIHAWGTIEQAAGYQILNVAGWEAGEVVNVPGLIRTSGGEDRLEGHDGQVYILPNLPTDLMDGTEVFVQGGVVGGILDWDLIQVMPDPTQRGGRPYGTPMGVGHIQEVELIYYAPPADYAPADARQGVDYRAILPVWRFRGHDDGGAGFEIYVQAVATLGEIPNE